MVSLATTAKTHMKTAPLNAQRRWLITAGARAALSLGVIGGPAWAQSAAAGFDHSHAAWTTLLKKHVKLIDGGKASQVRYAGMASDRAALKAYLETLTAVSATTFEAFSKAQQMAFLINAYNAFTVELILTRYPKLASIKDLGSLLQSPWKKKDVPLLGTQMSLDQIEHDTLRAKGRYDEPRVHFAVNCASIGCPALREEAFVPDRLEAQLEEQTQRFMADRSRNRYSAERDKVEVSKIFDWFGEDFRAGHKGITSLNQFLGRYASALTDAPAEREKLKAGSVAVAFLDYDWKLNDAR
jgi:Protein of unknown function, DUF547